MGYTLFVDDLVKNIVIRTYKHCCICKSTDGLQVCELSPKGLSRPTLGRVRVFCCLHVGDYTKWGIRLNRWIWRYLRLCDFLNRYFWSPFK